MDTRPGEPGSKGVAGQTEWYSVWDYLWQEAGMPLESEQLWSSGFLCIGCLEKRLGRELTAEDFPDYPINHQHDLDTPRLASRKQQHKKAPIIPATEPKYPVKKLTWWIIRAIDAGIAGGNPPFIDEEDFIEIGAPEWVWLAFQEELKEYFNIDDSDDADDEVPSVCPHCRMAGMTGTELEKQAVEEAYKSHPTKLFSAEDSAAQADVAAPVVEKEALDNG
jgi:hypothetical protein